jgi:hypothetical protein
MALFVEGAMDKPAGSFVRGVVRCMRHARPDPGVRRYGRPGKGESLLASRVAGDTDVGRLPIPDVRRVRRLLQRGPPRPEPGLVGLIEE